MSGYLGEGLEIIHDDGLIEDINIFLHPDEQEKFCAYQGEIYHQGCKIDYQNIQSVHLLADCLGAPASATAEKNEAYLIYEHESGRRAVFNFGSQGRLKLIVFDR